MKLSSIYLLALLLVLQSCNKDDDQPQEPIDQLPPATQTGENTFGCLVNGEPFVVTNTSLLTAIYQGGILVVSGEIDNNDIDKSISFIVYNEEPIINSYDLTDIIQTNSGYSDFSDYPTSYCQYESENTIDGEFIVDYFDTENFIISGRFYMTTKTSDCDTIKITDGRYDLQYIP